MGRTRIRRIGWSTGAAALAIVVVMAGVIPAAAEPAPYRNALSTPAPTPTRSPSPTPTPTPPPTPVILPFSKVGTPTMTGTVMVGRKLTARGGTWSPTPRVSYQWQLNGVDVEGASSSIWIVPASAVGKRVTVVATGTLAGYRTTTAVSAASTPVAPASLVTASPRLTGVPSLGKTLRVSPGAWGPTPVSIGYQWLREGRPITGAVSSTYVPVAADLAKRVSVRVTVKKRGYTTAVRTTGSVKIGRAFTATAPSRISGTVEVGKTLTAVPGQWGPAPVTVKYQWYRGASPIAGATARTYTLTRTDAGQNVSVRTTGTKTGYTSITRHTTAVAVPLLLRVPASVTQTGSPTVGSTLTATRGTWGPGSVTFSYQWLRDGQAIPGATQKTYRLTDADGTTGISVRVTGRKAGYTSVVRTSDPVRVSWAFSVAPTPVIRGTLAAGKTLTAVAGTWSPKPDSLTYQWRIDGEAVRGQTSPTFVVPAWAAGRVVSVSVTARKKDHITVTRSAAGRSLSWSVGDTIGAGTPMREGVRLTSPDGSHSFGLLGDGNVALLKGATPVRTARTTGSLNSELQLTVSGDLRLVNTAGRILWSTGTAGRGVVALEIGDDDVLRLVTAEGASVWTSASLAAFADATAAAPGVPGRNGWAYPILDHGRFTTYSGHSGDDIAAPTGTPIYAMRGGKVAVREIWITSGCPSWAPNYTRQKEVVITSTVDGTSFTQVYAHLSEFLVGTGATVKAGQKIGKVGSTGCSTGPHLHTAFTVDGVRYAMYPRDVLGVSSY